MDDLRRTLEREMQQISPADFRIESVERRRRRRRRRQRIMTTVTAFVIAGLGVGMLARVMFDERYRPAADPAGRIAFISPGLGRTGDRLFAAAPDGSDVVAVADIHAEYPDWSPDGNSIAFDDGQNLNGSPLPMPNGHVYVVSVDGSSIRQIPSDVPASSPSWAPDGARLAVAAGGAGSSPGIAWLDVATGQTTKVTENPFVGYWDAEPDVSPDGAKIVFVRVRELVERGGERNLAALFVVDADGSGLRRLTPWIADVGTPEWSPDGARIAFNVADHGLGSGRTQIHVVDADGSGRAALTDDRSSSSFWPTWSPDGSAIIFTRWRGVGLPFELARIPSRGGTPVALGLPSGQGSNEADWSRS
jgi:Tol biopolymer transport system component